MASIISRSPEETFQFAREFAGRLKRDEVLALCGDFGAGKTQFVKGLASGLGVSVEVTSPTFTLIHEYPGGRLSLFHVDFYRLDTTAEAVNIGIDEYLRGGGVTAIEWADKFAELIPDGAVWIQFRALDDDTREITVP